MQTGPYRQGTYHLPITPAAAFWGCAQDHCSIFPTPRYDPAIVSLFYPSHPLSSSYSCSIPICTEFSCTKPRLGWIKTLLQCLLFPTVHHTSGPLCPPVHVSTTTQPLRNNISFPCFMLPNFVLKFCCWYLRPAALLLLCSYIKFNVSTRHFKHS